MQIVLVKDGRHVPVVRYQIAQVVFSASQVVKGEIKRHRRVAVQVSQQAVEKHQRVEIAEVEYTLRLFVHVPLLQIPENRQLTIN